MLRYKLYLRDILDSIRFIEKYTKGVSQDIFLKRRIVIDAVAMRVQVIGESIKKLPDKKKKGNLNWKYFEEVRNVISHAYFNVDAEILWDVVKNELSKLKAAVRKIK